MVGNPPYVPITQASSLLQPQAVDFFDEVICSYFCINLGMLFKGGDNSRGFWAQSR